jgi:hypothetical protein
VLADYFAGIPVTEIPGLGKSQIKRLCVDKERVNDFQANLELYDQQIRADGWWIAVDLPVELRAMRSTAFKFFKEVKAMHQDVRSTYLDVSHSSGYVTVDGIDFVPVYMIPRDVKRWPNLIPLFVRVLDFVKNIDWTDRITAKVHIDPELTEKWAEEVGASLPVSRRQLGEDVDMSESRDGG